ncbi:MAG: 6-phosphogluconolactonase [Croceitalea sp.]|nr:6-phosphogluconolactonase [Croceitalea sp.]
MEKRIFENKKDVAEQFSAYFANLVDGKSDFHVALSGGSTPKIVFDVLAESYGKTIDWSKVHFYWGDERCVPPSDDESNFKMTQKHLFSKIEVSKDNIHRILGELEPLREAYRYANLIEMNIDLIDDIPQFDLIILGMGDDGHTASIFPHEINLWHDEKFCVVATHPDSGQQRISLTGKVINNAKEVAFLVTGPSKAEKVKSILDKSEGFEQYPAALVRPSSGKLVWFLDHSAASQL